MRFGPFVVALALTACGPASQPSADGPGANRRALPSAAIIAAGENWQAQASPQDGAVSITVEDGFQAAGAWSPPLTTPSGYRLQAGDVTIDLQEAACDLNGMPYPMRAEVRAGARTFTGCAALRWDYQLIALMPQIDACIARSPDTRWVSFAGEHGGDGVLVRLAADGGGYDCRVAAGEDPSVATFGPRTETLSVASELAAIFVRARDGETQNPGGECYDAPEVRDDDGALLGWMIDPLGC